MENREILLGHLQDIEKWEEEQKGLFFWEKLGRLPFVFLDKLTPKFIQNKIGVLMNELGNYIHTGGQYLTSEKAMLDSIRDAAPTLEIKEVSDVSELSIDQMIMLSERLQTNRVKFATVQGASTGIGGIFTLAVDIPVVLGTALKSLQEIAMIHGYHPNDKEERIFIVKCLQFASADIVGKEAILKELSTMHEDKKEADNMVSQLQGWREVVYTYRDQFGWKKLFQMIPIAGMIFGAYANRSMIQDVTDAGMMLYRKRRIYEKLERLESMSES